jgi:hypothetical protein
MSRHLPSIFTDNQSPPPEIRKQAFRLLQQLFRPDDSSQLTCCSGQIDRRHGNAEGINLDMRLGRVAQSHSNVIR